MNETTLRPPLWLGTDFTKEIKQKRGKAKKKAKLCWSQSLRFKNEILIAKNKRELTSYELKSRIKLNMFLKGCS